MVHQLEEQTVVDVKPAGIAVIFEMNRDGHQLNAILFCQIRRQAGIGIRNDCNFWHGGL